MFRPLRALQTVSRRVDPKLGDGRNGLAPMTEEEFYKLANPFACNELVVDVGTSPLLPGWSVLCINM